MGISPDFLPNLHDETKNIDEGLGVGTLAHSVIATVLTATTSLALLGCDASSNASRPSQSVGVRQVSQPTLPKPSTKDTQAAPVAVPDRVEIPVQDTGGSFTVPVTVNGSITLRFMIDSGATDVSIPSDVASTLIRSGTIDSSDFIGTQTFMLADGSTAPSAEFRIRTLTVGSVTLHDVTASLSDTKAPLLLGQSFLKRLSGWSIDNDRGVLILTVSAKTQTSGANIATTGEIASSGNGAETGMDSTDSDEGRAAIARTMEYFVTSSAVTEPETLAPYYAPTVDYFGTSETRAAVLKAKLAFLKRWPTRSYIPRAGSSRVVCSAVGRCTVTGLVDWQAANAETGTKSSGTASFQLRYADGLLVAETSRVLSRALRSPTDSSPP
jgi:clan AA aspartic protease (TIGR02281 family)